MNDPEKDWLTGELEDLSDLTAPDTLIPKVMERVRTRIAEPIWLRWARAHQQLLRSLAVGIALVIACLAAWINPVQSASALVDQSPWLRAVASLLEVAQDLLSIVKVYQAPLWLCLALLVAGGYLACLLAALTVRRAAISRK
jgi:anti-sigma factor RsiW